jgi:hypothetical protein
VSTDFHNNLRMFLKNTGVWHVLHAHLELPEWLLSDSSTPQTPQQQGFETMRNSRRSSSSPEVHCGSAGHTADSWLKSGGISKSPRFINIFIDVLRLLATHKLCIWSLEDVQYADSESAELVQRIYSAKIPLVLILTYQSEDAISKDLRSVLFTALKLQLTPFTEAQTAEYVAETLHRDTEYILPLVAVIQEKSRGNIFYIREMLDTCYRKRCVYYGWRENAWLFDIDKVFETFESEEYGSSVTNDFLTQRLEELPLTTQKLLAWASLISGTLSFAFLKKLLLVEKVSTDSTVRPHLFSIDSCVFVSENVCAVFHQFIDVEIG